MKKRLFRQVVVALSLVSVLVQEERVARAQALPVLTEAFSGTVNEVIASAVEANLVRRGITVAANDATMAATENYISTAVNDASYASTALTTLAAVGGAPVWLTVALGVGALAAVGGAAWGLYSLTQTNGTGTTPDGQPMPLSMTLSPSAATQNFAYPGSSSVASGNSCGSSGSSSGATCWIAALAAGAPMYRGAGCLSTQLCWALPLQPSTSSQPGISYFTIDGQAELYATTPQQFAQWYTFLTTPVNANTSTPDLYGATETWTLSSWSIVSQSGGMNYVSVVVTDSKTGGGANGEPSYTHLLTFPTAGTAYGLVQPVTGSLLSIAPWIGSQETQPVPQQLLANMANQLWQDASSQPGYNGEPYSASNPITSQDIASAPETATWGDMLTAPAPVGSTVVPIAPTVSSSTGTTGTTGTTGSTGTATENDCTEFPNAAACQPLGTAPAAPALPTSSVSVSLSPWSIGPATGTCPAPITVTVFGSALAFDYTPLCTFAGKLQPLVLALCALAAALIVIWGLKS